MVKGFLVASVVALTTTSAQADFTQREKQEIIKQIDAMNLLTAAAGELMTHLTTHTSAAEAMEVQLAVHALSGASSARSNLLEGLVWLSGGDGSTVPEGSLTRSEPRSGSDRVGTSFHVFDAAFDSYRSADQALSSLRTACARDCGAADRAAGYLSQSLGLFETFDRGLSYASPWRDVSASGYDSDYATLLSALKWTDDQLSRAWHENNGLATVPSMVSRAAASGLNYQLMLWRVAWAYGLIVGVEHPSLVQQVSSTLTEINGNRTTAQIAMAKNLLSDFTVPAEGQGTGIGLPSYYANICIDKVAVLANSNFSRAAQAIGREIQHLCEAWWSSSGALWQASLHSGAAGGGSMSAGASSFPSGPAAEPAPSSPPDDVLPVAGPEPEGPDVSPAPDASVYKRLKAHLPRPGYWAQLPATEIGDTLVDATNASGLCDSINCGKSENRFLAWSGMAFDETAGRWWSAAGGGGRDYGGNEIYSWNFENHEWSRVTEPKPLTGRRLRDRNGRRLTCRKPAAGPPATRTHDGILYVPTTNEILLMGTTPYCTAGTAGEYTSWVWKINKKKWRKINLPNTSNPKTVFDRARGLVYAIAQRGRFYAYDPADNYRVVQDVNLRHASRGNAQFDDRTRYLYWTSYNDGIYRSRVGLDGSVSAPRAVVDWEKAGITDKYQAFEIHTPSGDLVQWEGGPNVYRVNPETGNVSDVTPPSGPHPPSSQPNAGRVFSKWVYVDSVDAFIGIDDARDGIWIYRLP